jgi:hypothetical protein
MIMFRLPVVHIPIDLEDQDKCLSKCQFLKEIKSKGQDTEYECGYYGPLTRLMVHPKRHRLCLLQATPAE